MQKWPRNLFGTVVFALDVSQILLIQRNCCMNREWEIKLLIQWSKAEDTKYFMHWQKNFGNISLIEQTSWLTPYVIWQAITAEISVAKS